MTVVGFIGLEGVGQKLALNLVSHGFQVIVRDTDQSVATPLLSAGAQWGYSHVDVANQSDLLITCFESHGESARVLEGPNGALCGLSSGNFWVEMSPIEPAELRRLARLTEEKGAEALDAPVGNPEGADNGSASVFVGGTSEGFFGVLPVLEVLANDIVHTGELGTASVMAEVVSYLAGVQLVSTGEAMMVAKKAGINLEVAYEAIRVSSSNSCGHESAGKAVLNGSYGAGVSLGRQIKDVTLFDELGKTFDIPLELSPMLVRIMQDGVDSFGPDAWSAMVIKRLEEACQEDLRAPGLGTG